MKSCFQELAADLGDLTDPQQRPVFEYHQRRIAAIIGSQPDLAADEDTCAGFLHGVAAVRTYLVPEGTVEHESMPAVLGGILLLAFEADQAAPAPAVPASFFDRLASTIDVEPAAADWTVAEKEILAIQICARFATTPDVPLSPASLAGFVLGVLYVWPYLPDGNVAGLVGLVTAARYLAGQLRI